MYADSVTESMKNTIDETERRRALQTEYNKKRGITPKTISKSIREVLSATDEMPDSNIADIKISKTMDINMQIEILSEQMRLAATELRFEDAAKLRDKIKGLSEKIQ